MNLTSILKKIASIIISIILFYVGASTIYTATIEHGILFPLLLTFGVIMVITGIITILTFIREMLRIKIPERLRNYLKENWGAPFVIAFMILLIVAAVYLSLGIETTANDIATYAYYSLVIGVFLQLISYIRYERKENKESTKLT